MSSCVNFGPLEGLIGTWSGEKGLDVAPKSSGKEETEFGETLVFTAVGQVTNAGEESLTVVRYHQTVKRSCDDVVFHDETGYWMWNPKTDVIIHSLAIPRAVTVLAGGEYKKDEEAITFSVKAHVEDSDWGIIQSPFMQEKAKTISFENTLNLNGNELHYEELTLLDIYGKEFEHKDSNTLIKLS